jgi:hypothetical protein
VSNERAELATVVRELGAVWDVLGSPFNAVMLAHLADDIDEGGITWDLLGDIPEPARSMPGLRLLGGVHRIVLEGRLPELGRHYQSVGGDGDLDATWPLLHRAVVEHADELRPGLASPPQTNEVGRAPGLASGFLVVTHETRLPLRLLEVGCSAGLNLRADRYWYESGGVGVGDPGSRVRFVEPWDGGHPPLDGGLTVVDRRGCDARPIDATTSEGRLTLSCYVPPDQLERFERLQAALDVAARVPAPIDTADAADWLETQLASLPEGQATVVFHSIAWQYFDAATDTRARAAIETAGATATATSPLAWLSCELPTDPAEDPIAQLRLRTWPGDEERLLAITWPHGPPVHWRAPT